MSEPPIDPIRLALRELQDLLQAAATGPSPSRTSAVRYAHCRGIVFASELRPLLPGFLVQCGSIERFRDFICLYHSDVASRLAFIDANLEPCWARIDEAADAPDSEPPGPSLVWSQET